MQPLEHCKCGCQTLLRGASYVNDYHEHLHKEGQVWKSYPASLPQRVPPEPHYPIEERPCPYPSLTVADLKRVGLNRQHAVWLALFEAGRSIAEIATRYNQPLEDVEHTLHELSTQPIPVRRRVLPTVESDAEAKRNAALWRNRMRYLAQHEHWSVAQLRQEFPDYSTSVIQKIIATPYRPLTSARACGHCGAPIQGKRSTKRFCGDPCRRDFHRNLARSAA